jgi:hypothetical protein
MNLILSDVEETIMLVDGTESAPPGQGVVNVPLHFPTVAGLFSHTVPGGEKKDGNAFRERRWRYSGTSILLRRVVRLNPPRYRLHLGRNFCPRFRHSWLLTLSGSARFRTPRHVKHDMYIIAESSYESCVSNISLWKKQLVTASVQGWRGISLTIHTCASFNDAYNNTLSSSLYMSSHTHAFNTHVCYRPSG